jgi:hypothetical protein
MGMMGHQPNMAVMGPHGGVVVITGKGMGMPHVLNGCHKCNNTHRNLKKGGFCKYCVCEKCGGDGWKEQKGRICKKMKVKH